jgi:CBS domain containing-hemolysin-like protein
VGAWRLGVEAGRSARAASGEDGGGEPLAAGVKAHRDTSNEGAKPLEAAVNRMTKWIPGEAVALYVAAVTAFSAAANARPSVVLLIAFVLVTGLIVILGEFATTGSIPKKSLLSAVLAMVAFVIWSLTVPFSGWQRWSSVHDNQAAVAVLAAVVAVLFGLLAEGVKKRWGTP